MAVRQLTGLDAMHVLEERPGRYMHTLKIVVFDAAAAREPVTFDSTKRWAAQHLVQVELLRRLLVKVPMGIARPFWVDAGTVDVDAHVFAASAAAPGDDEAFDAVLSEIASLPLARDRPLWELWFVDGLAGGRVALVFKLSHALADGVASVRLLEEIFGADADAEDTSVAEPVPSGWRRLALGARTQVQQWRQFPSMVRRTGAGVMRYTARKAAGLPQVTRPLAGPLTRFNRELTPNRLYVNVTVPLHELVEVKQALGVTVNDVFIALCGGALRRYLAEQGELPPRSLTAASPVSIRTDDEADRFGNRTSYWNVSLATDVEDPVERVRAVQTSTAAAREWAEADRTLFADWQDYFRLFELFTNHMFRMMEAVSGRPTMNAVVSNVRGPGPLVHLGAPITEVRSMGPIVRRQGVNFTAWSYLDDFAVGLHACAEHAPNLRRLAECFVEELDDLHGAAAARAASAV